MRLPAVSFDKNSQDVMLTEGTPVIAKRNDNDRELCDSETFIITDINTKDEYVQLTENGWKKTLNIHFEEFQQFFYVAWCITLHKSQGCTFDHECTIHEMGRPRFDYRAKYVALSRSTTLGYIKVW